MAKRFRFRLEQVLGFRKQMEEVRVRELARAKGQLLKIEDEIRENGREESRFLEMYGDFEKTGLFDSDQVMAYCEYKEWLSNREKAVRRREQEWSREVERRRQAAVLASRDRQLLDNLREKQVQTHAKETADEEQKFLDEISSIAFARKARAVQNQKVVTHEPHSASGKSGGNLGR